MDVKKVRISIYLYPKIQLESIFLLVLSFPFYYFFCNFHMKQEILVDNKIRNKKRDEKWIKTRMI